MIAIDGLMLPAGRSKALAGHSDLFGPEVEAVGPCCRSVGSRADVVGCSTDVVGGSTALGMAALRIVAVRSRKVEPRVCRDLGGLGGRVGDSVGHARWCSDSWGSRQCG